MAAKTSGKRGARQLRSTPSTPEDLTDMQFKLMTDFDALFHQHQEERTPLSKLIQDVEDKYKLDPSSLRAEVKSLLEAVGCKDEVIKTHLETTLPEAQNEEIIGLRLISPLNFSYKPESLWRGEPSNHTIRKLARSIVVSSFRSDSVVSSRTLRVSGEPFSLALGDGSARAVAATIVWILVAKRKAELSPDDFSMQKLVWSLSGINVNFERHGAGTPKDCLIAQVSRQNQAAAVQPVSTVQWLGMIRQYLGEAIGTSFKGTSQVQQVLEDLVDSYNKSADVMAYDVDAAHVRKKRRSKAGAVPNDEPGEGGLKISRRRILGMKSFLSGANDEVLHELEKHIVVVGDYKTSAITDDILQLKFIYVGSKLPKELLPSEAQLTAMHAAGDVVKSWMQDEANVAEIRYDAPLSTDQFAMLWRKMIRTYEVAIEGMTSPEAKQKERPSQDDWTRARQIIQLWDESMMPVVSQCLSTDDFEAIKRLVLEGNTLDAQLGAIVERHPKYFHMGLIPSIAADDAESVDVRHKRIAEAHAIVEGATFSVFADELQMDWDTIQQASKSTACLGELLSWIEISHRQSQAKIGEELVRSFCNKLFPLLSASEWSKCSTQVSLLKQAFSCSAPLRAIVVMDFNVPSARDVLKMPRMIHAAAEIVKVLGSDHCIVMAIMPNASKKDSETTAFDDEVTISKCLTKAGFAHQDRVRQLVDMPDSISNKVSQLDWFVDSRLCCMGEPVSNFWVKGSELCRTKAIMERACVSDPDDLIDCTSLQADEDLNTSDRHQDIAGKLAQRGVEVAKAQIRALLSKSKRGGTEWLTPETMVSVLDLTPFVGDRALATLSLREELKSETQLSHCTFQVGKGVSANHAEFCAKCVAQHVATLWFDSKIELTDFAGRPVKVDPCVPEPTPAELKMHPTAELAYKGIRNLDFKVCTLVGGKVLLRPDKLAPFASASKEIQDRVNGLKEKHDAKYASRLATCIVDNDRPGIGPEDVLADPRDDPDGALVPFETPQNGQNDLSVLDSIAVLNANFVAVECNSMVKGIKMFRDPAKHAIFLYSKTEDHVIKAGDCLGGIGGGSILDADPNKVGAVPWLLTSGDKTWVQRATSKGDDKEEGKKPKFESGSMYSILRELERKSTQPISLTSYGEALSVKESGRQEYHFKNVPGTEAFRKVEYVLSPVKPNAKLSSGNFFGPFVARDSGLGAGALQLTWRLSFEPVSHTLKPQKVYVTASQRIELPKGKPVKVCWKPEPGPAAV